MKRVISCSRADRARRLLPASEIARLGKAKCGACGVDVVVSPSVKPALEAGFIPVCDDCVIQYAEDGKPLAILPPSQEQRDELEGLKNRLAGRN